MPGDSSLDHLLVVEMDLVQRRSGFENTGGGGGGSERSPAPPNKFYMGGNGGSGIVIIAYDIPNFILLRLTIKKIISLQQD